MAFKKTAGEKSTHYRHRREEVRGVVTNTLVQRVVMGRTVRRGQKLAHFMLVGQSLCMCACTGILESTVLLTAREYQTLSKRTLSYAALQGREHQFTADSSASVYK